MSRVLIFGTLLTDLATDFSYGDVVVFRSAFDPELYYDIGWDPDMESRIGQRGVVIEIKTFECGPGARVRFSGRGDHYCTWWIPFIALVPA